MYIFLSLTDNMVHGVLSDQKNQLKSKEVNYEMCLYIIKAEMPTSENLKCAHSVSCILPTLNINNQPTLPPNPKTPPAPYNPDTPITLGHKMTSYLRYRLSQFSLL